VYFYVTRLNQSKEENKSIVSRAIITKPTTEESKPFTVESKAISKFGQFMILDAIHYANGTVGISENGDNIKIIFSDDFKTNPDGPDLHVWLIKDQNLTNYALGGVSDKAGDYLDLGLLQSKSGTQAYQVTKAEFKDYNFAVVIWCKAFGVQFSNAILSNTK
jgi:hypothetical protein